MRGSREDSWGDLAVRGITAKGEIRAQSAAATTMAVYVLRYELPCGTGIDHPADATAATGTGDGATKCGVVVSSIAQFPRRPQTRHRDTPWLAVSDAPEIKLGMNDVLPSLSDGKSPENGIRRQHRRQLTSGAAAPASGHVTHPSIPPIESCSRHRPSHHTDRTVTALRDITAHDVRQTPTVGKRHVKLGGS